MKIFTLIHDMKKIRKLSVAMAAFLCFGLSAEAEINQLRISLKDGRTITVDLTEVTRTVGGETVTLYPTMKFSPEATSVQFVVPSKSETEAPVIHTLEVEDLQGMAPIETVTSAIAGVVAPESDIVIKALGGNELLVTCPEALSAGSVRVYDLGGRSVVVGITESAGGLMLSLESLSAGVYIVNVESVTIKIVKK